MRVILMCIGKTDDKLVISSIDNYAKRLKHYINFEIQIIPDLKKSKNLTQEQQKVKEGEVVLKHINRTDYVVLLDERGLIYSSIGFSDFIEQKMVQSVSRLVFVIGGPYGFSEAIYERADSQLSLSKMTFSHQMIRLFIIEQLYRAFTIIRGEPYHHE